MRSVRRLAGLLVMCALAPSMIACGGGDEEEKFKIEPEDTLEIISWWTVGAEADALQALYTEFDAKYPGVTKINAADDSPTDARTLIAQRMNSGDPPDSFQAISGADLLTYANAGKMRPVDDLAEALGWTGAFPEAVLETLRGNDGKLYAVPVNIEQDNNLYYNKAVFEAQQLEPPTTLDDFFNVCTKFQDAGIVPLSVPAAGWVLALVGFEALMPQVSGGEYYNSFFRGEANPGGPELRNFFGTFQKVLECSNVAEPNENWGRWDTLADELYDGRAAMWVMGDWGNGYLQGASYWDMTPRTPWEPNVDFGSVEAFGNGGYFTFNSAVFGVPAGAVHPNAGSAWLDIVGSQAGQVAFNAKKGSVPARGNASIDGIDPLVEASQTAFTEAGAQENKLLGGYATMTTLAFQLPVNDALLVFAVGGARAKELNPDLTAGFETFEQYDVDFIINTIASNYSVIN